MIYKNFKDLKLSNLGFGTMRLPCIEQNGESIINEEETSKMVEYAINNGINYFDTAYGYHNGKSEIVIGKILNKYPRESYYIATKFPGYDLANMDKVEEIFEKQLEKTKMKYFDFYLFHNVNEKNIDAYLDEKYGIIQYLLKQKENGRIKHLGFSVHGSYNVMKRFLDAYGKYMEFCQIQLNYLDYKFQDAKAKIELLRKWNIPIWVMEPLRGGKLATISDKYKERLNSIRPDESIHGWAFRFLQTFPDVTIVLSGMSSIEQMKDNIKIFEENKPLNEDEMKEILNIADDMLKGNTVPCTACRYCTSKCPKGLDIPEILRLYNEHKFTGGGFIAPMVISTLPEDKKPSACIGCRNCESLCPQGIKVSEIMKDFSQLLN